jgi:hypothetical protein
MMDLHDFTPCSMSIREGFHARSLQKSVEFSITCSRSSGSNSRSRVCDHYLDWELAGDKILLQEDLGHVDFDEGGAY